MKFDGTVWQALDLVVVKFVQSDSQIHIKHIKLDPFAKEEENKMVVTNCSSSAVDSHI